MSYVNTLARLIEDIQRNQNPGAEKEARIAINKMREHIVKNHGMLMFEAIEDDAQYALNAKPREWIL